MVWRKRILFSLFAFFPLSFSFVSISWAAVVSIEGSSKITVDGQWGDWVGIDEKVKGGIGISVTHDKENIYLILRGANSFNSMQMLGAFKQTLNLTFKPDTEKKRALLVSICYPGISQDFPKQRKESFQPGEGRPHQGEMGSRPKGISEKMIKLANERKSIEASVKIDGKSQDVPEEDLTNMYFAVGVQNDSDTTMEMKIPIALVSSKFPRTIKFNITASALDETLLKGMGQKPNRPPQGGMPPGGGMGGGGMPPGGGMGGGPGGGGPPQEESHSAINVDFLIKLKTADKK